MSFLDPVPLPCPSSPCFFGKRQGKPPKKQGFFIPTEPLNPWKRREKRSKKTRNSSQGEKTRNSKKTRKDRVPQETKLESAKNFSRQISRHFSPDALQLQIPNLMAFFTLQAFVLETAAGRVLQQRGEEFVKQVDFRSTLLVESPSQGACGHCCCRRT